MANLYLTKKIREGFEKADVDMFAALCQQCKTDVGRSREYMFLLLDMAKHNDDCDVLEIVKTGRVCSSQNSINDKFIDGLINAVASDDERDTSTKVLDLTCDEELSESSSGSYEETTEPGYYNDNPTSAEAYEIDGFVVPDHHCPPDADDYGCEECGTTQEKKLDKMKASSGVKRKLKRREE